MRQFKQRFIYNTVNGVITTALGALLLVCWIAAFCNGKVEIESLTIVLPAVVLLLGLPGINTKPPVAGTGTGAALLVLVCAFAGLQSCRSSVPHTTGQVSDSIQYREVVRYEKVVVPAEQETIYLDVPCPALFDSIGGKWRVKGQTSTQKGRVRVGVAAQNKGVIAIECNCDSVVNLLKSKEVFQRQGRSKTQITACDPCTTPWYDMWSRIVAAFSLGILGTRLFIKRTNLFS